MRQDHKFQDIKRIELSDVRIVGPVATLGFCRGHSWQHARAVLSLISLNYRARNHPTVTVNPLLYTHSRQPTGVAFSYCTMHPTECFFRL